MDAVERNGYELIHLADSPDRYLAHSDFFLFPNLKKDIRGCHFWSEEEVVTAVWEWVNGDNPDFFSSGLMALEHRWSKCITLEVSYIEKEEVISTGYKLRLVTYQLAVVATFRKDDTAGKKQIGGEERPSVFVKNKNKKKHFYLFIVVSFVTVTIRLMTKLSAYIGNV